MLFRRSRLRKMASVTSKYRNRTSTLTSFSISSGIHNEAKADTHLVHLLCYSDDRLYCAMSDKLSQCDSVRGEYRKVRRAKAGECIRLQARHKG